MRSSRKKKKICRCDGTPRAFGVALCLCVGGMCGRAFIWLDGRVVHNWVEVGGWEIEGMMEEMGVGVMG